MKIYECQAFLSLISKLFFVVKVDVFEGQNVCRCRRMLWRKKEEINFVIFIKMRYTPASYIGIYYIYIHFAIFAPTTTSCAPWVQTCRSSTTFKKCDAKFPEIFPHAFYKGYHILFKSPM